MKTIFSIILILFAFTAQAQKADTTELTKERIYNDVKAAITQISGALEVGAEHVYGVLVRQQFVSSVSLLIGYCFGFIMSAVSWFVVHSTYKKLDDDDWSPLYMIPVFLTVTTLVVVFMTMGDCITGFVNPEYGAIKEILKAI